MKIRAIRLREVGRFSAPVALEGLTGGLDVLCGPNEFGKSTILKAVNTALFVPHTSKKQEIEELRPYSGGAPLIELDLELGNRLWRLRKQYLSTRSAELRDLATGQLCRGADAEAQLLSLLGSSGHFALLCVTQGTALAAMSPTRTGGETFMGAIEKEVESVADGNASRLVAERVRSELAGLMTSHTPPRPSGALKAALEERDRLGKQRDDALARMQRAQARLDTLEKVRAGLIELSDPDKATARQQAAHSARHAFEDAREATDKVRAAEAAVAACEKQLTAAQTMLHSLDQAIAELARREATAAQIAPLLAEGEARASACTERVAAEREKRDALKRLLVEIERDRKTVERRQRLAEIEQRLEIARAAEIERSEASALLAGNSADDRLIDAARREAASIAKLEARLAAAAPRVSLAYAPGAHGKVKVDGRPLEDGEVLQPTRPLTIEIAGIGVLTIEPGQSEDVAADEAAITAHRQKLSDHLQRAGAATVEEAERLLTDRRAAEMRLADATARLNASAREGIESLQRAHAELESSTSLADALPSYEEMESRAREAMAQLSTAETLVSNAEHAERAARDEVATLRARAAACAADIAKLNDDLGTPEQRGDEHQRRLAAVAAAQSALNTSVREGAAWREKAPDAAHFDDLKRAVQTVEAALERSRSELDSLRRQEAGLLGELRTDSADDIEARLDELNDLCARADARCSELQEEAAALLLLAQELDAAATRTRDRYTRPVVARLDPYLQRVMPQARLVLGEDLAPHALERGTAREDFARLSGGTQEQLGLLVRLAFARLLADNGTPAPLIIDDAVVNTDDQRLQRLFDALRQAAGSHQVLAITCRQRDFESLGGHQVSLCDWKDIRAAA